MEFFNKPGGGRVDRPQVMKVEPRRHEFKRVQVWRRQPGHTVFSFNTVTKEIRVAEIKAEPVINAMTRSAEVKRKIFVEKDCIYVEALNKKNVIKLLRRDGLL